MDNSFAVEMTEGLKQGSIHEGYSLLFELFLLFKDLKELSIWTKLHKCIDVSLICEDREKLDYVLVIDEGLYF